MDPTVEVLPLPQVWHAVAPTFENLPAGHGVGAVELHDEPAGQGRAAVRASVGQNEPWGQGTAAVRPTVGQNEPAGHAVAAVMPSDGQNEPAGHTAAANFVHHDPAWHCLHDELPTVSW